MKRKILYVDDESYNLTLFQLQFQQHFEVITYDNPLLVKDILVQASIPLLITDYQMPELNGMELIQQMKKLNPALVCIILSGLPNLQNEIDLTMVFDFVTKPYDQERMHKIIELGLAQYDMNMLKNVS